MGLSGDLDTTTASKNGENANSEQLHVKTRGQVPNDSYTVKERMAQSLRLFKESTDQLVLVQVWAPVKNGDTYVLTTLGQPSVLVSHSHKLLQYRKVSLRYFFSVNEDCGGDLGLPGRVFMERVPEWTPNVQYYSSKEYMRLSYAVIYDVQGTLALPILEPTGESCVGVVELVMTSPRIKYADEIDKICKALEAVNLRSSEIFLHPGVEARHDEARQLALSEILEILSAVCEAHKLPLAQTWVRCKHCSSVRQCVRLQSNYSGSEQKCTEQVFISTSDVEFYITDASMWGFREACAEHHLQRGQGVVGKAFATGRSYLCADVTKYSKREYPLVHYTRMFGLGGCLAICLQSHLSCNQDYVLEFFLPLDCRSAAEQKALLDAISTMMRECFCRLKVIAGNNFQDLLSEIITDDNSLLETCILIRNENNTNISKFPERDNPKGQCDSGEEGQASYCVENRHLVTDATSEKYTFNPIGSAGECGPLLGKENTRSGERRRGKAEKSISLEVLQKYFAGSLKDAAKSLGVCPTTMKRICRQHGIPRWPSRRINKVTRSLCKLKHVIQSVESAGASRLNSVASPLPAVGGSLPRSVSLKISDRKVGQSHVKCQEKDDGNNGAISLLEQGLDRASPQLEHGGVPHFAKLRVSPQASTSNPTSQGSCQGSPVDETALDSPQFSPSKLKQGGVDHAPFVPVFTQSSHRQDSGPNKPSSTGSDARPQLAGMSTKFSGQESNVVTVKASYREDIIRFRLSRSAGVKALKEEVAMRLKLEIGAFDIKYLDDDHEWVLLSCDADLEECLEISRSSQARIIRLLVDDIAANFGSSVGSSCESSDD